MLPLVDPITARQSLRRSLSRYLEEIANGNVLAFTEYIMCPGGMLQQLPRWQGAPPDRKVAANSPVPKRFGHQFLCSRGTNAHGH
jgi:hypothetical protein